MKKLLLSLGALATIVAPVAAVVACGSDTTTDKPKAGAGHMSAAELTSNKTQAVLSKVTQTEVVEASKKAGELIKLLGLPDGSFTAMQGSTYVWNAQDLTLTYKKLIQNAPWGSVITIKPKAVSTETPAGTPTPAGTGTVVTKDAVLDAPWDNDADGKADSSKTASELIALDGVVSETEATSIANIFGITFTDAAKEAFGENILSNDPDQVTVAAAFESSTNTLKITVTHKGNAKEHDVVLTPKTADAVLDAPFDTLKDGAYTSTLDQAALDAITPIASPTIDLIESTYGITLSDVAKTALGGSATDVTLSLNPAGNTLIAIVGHNGGTHSLTFSITPKAEVVTATPIVSTKTADKLKALAAFTGDGMDVTDINAFYGISLAKDDLDDGYGMISLDDIKFNPNTLTLTFTETMSGTSYAYVLTAA